MSQDYLIPLTFTSAAADGAVDFRTLFSARALHPLAARHAALAARMAALEASGRNSSILEAYADAVPNLPPPVNGAVAGAV
jgi:hypothetical protein